MGFTRERRNPSAAAALARVWLAGLPAWSRLAAQAGVRGGICCDGFNRRDGKRLFCSRVASARADTTTGLLELDGGRSSGRL